MITEIHQLVINLAAQGLGTKEIADAAGISVRTVQRWKSKFAKEIMAVTDVQSELDDEEDNWDDWDNEDDDWDNVDSDETQPTFSFTLTRSSLTIDELDDEEMVVETRQIDKTRPGYDEFIAQILDANSDSEEQLQKVLAKIYETIRPAAAIKKFTDGRITIDPASKTIVFSASNGQDYPIHSNLTEKILETVLEEKDPSKLIRFLDNMMDNPSSKSVANLYNFLVHNDIKITDDGHFIAWKAVRNTYMDKHSNTIDNSPGQRPSMPRNMVNENEADLCSYGLHACSEAYLNFFASSGDRIVSVKINPRDVVSVPLDYDGKKLRCSEYLVVEDVTDKFKHYV